MYRFTLVVIVFSLLFTGHVYANKDKDVSPIKGFILSPFAAKKFVPGYIYRYADGKQYETTRWHFNAPCETNEVPRLKTTAVTNVNGMLGFLKISPLAAQLSAGYKNLLDVDFNVDKPCSRVVNDVAYEQMFKRKGPELIELISDIKYKDFEFYVVKESIETKKMALTVKSQTRFEGGLWAKFKRLINIEVGVDSQDDSVVEYSFDNSEELVVLIKVDRFYTESNSSGGLVLKREKVNQEHYFINKDSND